MRSWLAVHFVMIFGLLLFNNQENIAQIQSVELNWLDGKTPSHLPGTTLGVPWPRGVVEEDQAFAIESGSSERIAVQTWPLAYWPDGSVKWSGIAAPAGFKSDDQLKLTRASKVVHGNKIVVKDAHNRIDINNDLIEVVIDKSGNTPLRSISYKGKLMAENGRLVMTTQNAATFENNKSIEQIPFNGKIESVEIEQEGPVRAVVKMEGIHEAPEHSDLIPFVLRLYFYANSTNIRVVHTMIYDGDEHVDFISGLGFRFNIPMADKLHNRHVRFTGENDGLFGEAVKGLTGLRRDPGHEIKQAQIEGKKTPPVEEFPERVRKGLPYIPVFGDYTLHQKAPNAFSISKRTGVGHSWLTSAYGQRSSGVGYLGGPSGGMAFGIKNFWQSFPGQLDIRNAGSSNAEVTMWFWAPGSDPMDLRFYHDGMGQDTYEKQWEGLEITYEDYEPGFGRPIGVARTSEFNLWAVPSTPSRQDIIEYAGIVAQPPVLIADLGHIQNTDVFGGLWTVRQETRNPVKQQVYERLDWLFDYYQTQQEQHSWYGFWDYGDVMHTYDPDRHVWRYDVGGYAWDNSELSTDLWLWYYFLHSGRADAFRMAEAMTRHTGEVDVHHIGPFAPLGSRHNVQHWGCSAKQLRISTAANRRFYFYLTADERTGDLLEAQVEAHRALLDVPPLRKRMDVDISDSSKVYLSFGTDWGSLAAAWLTQWERTGDEKMGAKLKASMNSIAAQPHGFFSGGGMMDVETGIFEISESQRATTSHLSAVFGLMETCTELIDLTELPAFEEAWLQYCRFYSASSDEQIAELGSAMRNQSLRQGHSRLTAYAAMKMNDPELANRAWNEFTNDNAGRSLRIPDLEEINPPDVLSPVVEVPYISTNYTAQWGLAAMQIMSLLDDDFFDGKKNAFPIERE